MSDDEKAMSRALVLQAMQGDAASIDALADKIYETTHSPAPVDDGRVPVANFDAAVNNRADFLEAVQAFRREYPDLCERPDWYATVKEADTWLAQNRPGMSYIQRLRHAGNATRAQKDRDEDGDEHARKKVILRMKGTRGVNREDDDPTGFAEPTSLDYENSEADEFERENSAAIAEIAAARRAGREELGD